MCFVLLCSSQLYSSRSAVNAQIEFLLVQLGTQKVSVINVVEADYSNWITGGAGDRTGKNKTTVLYKLGKIIRVNLSGSHADLHVVTAAEFMFEGAANLFAIADKYKRELMSSQAVYRPSDVPRIWKITLGMGTELKSGGTILLLLCSAW